MKYAGLLLVLVLAGCAQRGPTVADVLRAADGSEFKCRASSQLMAAYDSCIAREIASNPLLNSGPSADLPVRYSSGTKLLAEAVRDGKMTDVAAISLAVNYYGELKAEYLSRVATAQARANQEFQSSVLLYATIQQMQPTYYAPTLQTPRPAQSTCVQQGVFQNCTNF